MKKLIISSILFVSCALNSMQMSQQEVKINSSLSIERSEKLQHDRFVALIAQGANSLVKTSTSQTPPIKRYFLEESTDAFNAIIDLKEELEDGTKILIDSFGVPPMFMPVFGQYIFNPGQTMFAIKVENPMTKIKAMWAVYSISDPTKYITIKTQDAIEFVATNRVKVAAGDLYDATTGMLIVD